ncbi:MAG: ATP-binding protein, partial [Gemmatimonadales bacterium]|nr:ATP-binding protein [Gemmatimonadales bacterium]
LTGAPGFRDPDDLVGARTLLERARAGAHPPPAPSLQWRFGELVESPSTRMAFEAARAAVQEPGSRYNPLVIAGPPGVGKTHLLHAIGNALAERGDGPVACLGAAEFSDELITAIDREQVDAWRARYRRCSALLLDDVHLIGGRDRTQDELFVLFNALMESGRQMVFTCAGTPGKLPDIEPRLLTRLEGGLVVELPLADRDVRFGVALRLLTEELGAGDPDLAEYLASRAVETVRAMQSLVQRVLHAAEHAGEAVPSAAFARELLEGPVSAPVAKVAPTRLTSGVPTPSPSGIRSREKMVWDWPNVGDRLIEEWR